MIALEPVSAGILSGTLIFLIGATLARLPFVNNDRLYFSSFALLGAAIAAHGWIFEQPAFAGLGGGLLCLSALTWNRAIKRAQTP